MTPPPFIAFPLLDAIYEQNAALLAGQREAHRLLTSILSENHIMGTAQDRIAADISKISADVAAISTKLAEVAATATAEQQAQLNPLADSLDAAVAALDAAVAPAAAPAEPAAGEQQIPPS